MAVGFGGGPPLLSLLTGVATGITAGQRRAEERKRQAYLDALRAAADRRAEANLDLARRRQQSYDDQIAYVRERDAASDAADAAEAASDEEAAAEQERLVQQRAAELRENDGMGLAASLTRARQEVGGRVSTPIPEPETPPDERTQLLNESTRLSNADRREAQRRRAAMDAIRSDRTLLSQVENASSREEVASIYDQAGVENATDGKVTRADFVRAWEELGGEDSADVGSQPTRGDAPTLGLASAMSQVFSTARRDGLDINNTDVATDVAARVLAGLNQELNDPQHLDALSQNPAYLRTAYEMRDILQRAARGDADALRELGIGQSGSRNGVR